MSTPGRRRLMRDFKRLQDDPPSGVSGAPTENNIMLWNAVIFGPDDTPFEVYHFRPSEPQIFENRSNLASNSTASNRKFSATFERHLTIKWCLILPTDFIVIRN